MLTVICFFILCFGVTSARFTSTFQSRSNNIKSGTIKLVIGKNIIYTGGEIKNIYPGWNSESKITVKNEGTLPLKYEVGTEVFNDSILCSGKYPFKVSINSMQLCDINKMGRVYMGVLEPGDDDTLSIKLKLPEEADNECMGKECSFNFIFYSFQDNSSNDNKTDMTVGKNFKENELEDGKHFTSIEKALENAPEGGVILIEKGEYTPDGNILTIKKNVTLSGKGESSSEVVINGTINICGCTKDDNPTLIRNITVQNIGNNKGTWHGIVLNNAQNITISNVCCTNNYNGIVIKGICSNVKIDNCSFDNNKNFGFSIGKNSIIRDSSINNCKIRKNGTGVYSEGICSGLNIKDCLVNDNKDRGLYFEKISDSFICNTEIAKSNLTRKSKYTGIEVCIKDGEVKNTVFKKVNVSSDKKIDSENADIKGIKIWPWSNSDKTKIKDIIFTDCSIKNFKESLSIHGISDDTVRFENLITE